MKEIKAYIHRNRIADVMHALRVAGFQNVCTVDIKGTLEALGTQEQEYSIEMGERVINAVQLELVCQSTEVDAVVRTIRENSRTGQRNAGWVNVSSVDAIYEIACETDLDRTEGD